MTNAEAIALIRRGIREPRPETVRDTTITGVITQGVYFIGRKLKEKDPLFFTKRSSVSSNTHVFDWPSDCIGVQKVWDLGDTASTITDATNASPIVITSASHGWSTGEIVFIHDILGNTAANGTWKITVVDTDSYSLDGSTGNAAYTSGGTVFAEPSDPDEIVKINMAEASLSHSDKWYPRGKKIVVDDETFTNDIIIDYLYLPTAVTDIPTEYHAAVVAYGCINLVVMPKPDDPGYADKRTSLEFQQMVFEEAMNDIAVNFETSTEPKFIRDVWST